MFNKCFYTGSPFRKQDNITICDNPNPLSRFYVLWSIKRRKLGKSNTGTRVPLDLKMTTF